MAYNPLPLSPHRIGIMISATGRFLQCSVCKLSYIFPDNEQFGTVAKQFASYACSSAIAVLVSGVADGALQGKERCLIILRYEGSIPMMASCAKCERKFFTLATFSRDPMAAEEYLAHRFAAHQCE
jgi:hypothetical protein